MFDFVVTSDFWGEVAKLVAQLGGALFIAWLTVRWALGRYKREKLWERETQALFDVLTAIAQMHQINGEWLDDELTKVSRTEDYHQKRAGQWWEARRQLEAASAIASVVFPSEVASALDKILLELNKAPGKDYHAYYDQLDSIQDVLRSGRSSIIQFGQLRTRGQR